MGKYILISSFCLLLLSLMGLSSEPTDGIRLSSDWVSGPNLIYDCRNQYWVCVDESGRRSCEERRVWAKNIGRLNLDCAFIIDLKGEAECTRNLKLKVEGIQETPFCEITFLKGRDPEEAVNGHQGQGFNENLNDKVGKP